MAIMVRTCCCCCDLRIGVLLVGIFGLLYSGYGMYSSYNGYNSATEIEEEWPFLADDNYFKVLPRLHLVGMAFAGISILACVMLLCSGGSKNPYLAFPYFFWNIFMLFYSFGVTIFLFVSFHELQFILLTSIVSVVWWLLSIYFVIVVYSYIQTLRQDPSAFDIAPPDPAIAMQPPSSYSSYP